MRGGIGRDFFCPAEECVEGTGMTKERRRGVDGGELGEVGEPRDDAYLADAQCLQGHPLSLVPMHVEGSPIFHLSPTYRGYHLM